MFAPRNATRRPYRAEAATNSPNSERQGPHHDAHALITIG